MIEKSPLPQTIEKILSHSHRKWMYMYFALMQIICLSWMSPRSDCAVKTPSKAAQDDEAARKLWDVSMKLVGLEEWMDSTSPNIIIIQ